MQVRTLLTWKRLEGRDGDVAGSHQTVCEMLDCNISYKCPELVAPDSSLVSGVVR